MAQERRPEEVDSTAPVGAQSSGGGESWPEAQGSTGVGATREGGGHDGKIIEEKREDAAEGEFDDLLFGERLILTFMLLNMRICRSRLCTSRQLPPVST